MMEDEDKRKFANLIAEMIEKDLDGLIYTEPKCDFEHAWNCAVTSCIDSLELYKEDKFIELNLDRLNEFEIVSQDCCEKDANATESEEKDDDL